jgi:hypothetical protein
MGTATKRVLSKKVTSPTLKIFSTSFKKIMEFVTITGNRRKVVLNGYGYTRQRPSTGTRWSHWACDQKHDKCKGRLHINPAETEWKEVGVHNHVANFGRIKAMKIKESIKNRVAAEPNVLPSCITQDELGRADSETLIELPKEKSIKKMAQRIREQALPVLPVTLEDLVEIPERYRRLRGEDWLLHDSGPENANRIIVFGLRSTIRAMAASMTWYGDGTFKSSPRLVRQLYTLHYQVHENVVLGLMVLMKTRIKEAYVELFEVLRDMLPQNRRNVRRRFSVDFELAASDAFTEVFPASVLSFCFFHFTQSLWRKAKESGAAAAYRHPDNEGLRSQFHAILGLAFVPEDHVVRAFDDLQTICAAELEDVLVLLEHYYVLGKRRGRGRLPPRYPIATWNVNNRTYEGEPRTNNSVEGWNRRFNSLVGKTHPNIFVVIEHLRKEENYAASQRELIDLGRSPPKKKVKYIKNDERLLRLVERFETMIEEAVEEPEDVLQQEAPWNHRYLRFTRAVGHSARGIMDYLLPRGDGDPSSDDDSSDDDNE